MALWTRHRRPTSPDSDAVPKRRRAPLLELGCLLAFSILAAPARAVDDGSEPLTRNESGLQQIFGALWWIGSGSGIDDVTFVHGGVEGSAALVVRDFIDQTARWHLLHGKLYVGTLQDPTYFTTTPGQVINTKYPDVVMGPPEEGDKKALCEHLVDLYYNNKNLRYVPFLMGKGWTSAAADHLQVKAYCNALGIPYVFLGPQTGRVVSQDPPGGVLFLKTTLQIILDGSSIPPVTVAERVTVPGDTWTEAIDPVQLGRLWTVPRAEVTDAHTDLLHCPLPGSAADQPDVFVEVPRALRGHEVHVEIRSSTLWTMTAWQLSGGRIVNIAHPSGSPHYSATTRPGLDFVAPSSRPSYVMLERRRGLTGAFRMTLNKGAAHPTDDDGDDSKQESPRKRSAR